MASAMNRIFQLFALLAVLAGPAFAETVGESQTRVVRLENEWTQLDASRVRLETESSQLAGDIERVKAEPAGVRRDFRLRELAGAVDEDWFGEATSNRKFARTTTIASATNGKTQGDSSQTPTAGAPAPQQPGVSGGMGGTTGGTPPGGSFSNDPGSSNN